MKLVRYISLFFALSAVVLAGCMGGKWGGGFSMPPAVVETAVATTRPVEDRFQTVGTIEADEAVTIVSEIGGIVVKIPFPEGGRVERGDLIALIDDSELKADLDRTTAMRDQAKLNYDRMKVIVNQGAEAQQQLDDASAALKVADANVALAQARFDKTRISAPFAGMVGARRISPGTYVQPGTPITDLARIQELRVSFAAPERYLPLLNRGSDVNVTTTALPDQDITGKIEILEPQVDPGTRNIGIVARIPNPDDRLRPGMSADVAAVLRQRPAALTIPSEAVVIDQNQPVVYVIKPDSTVTRTVVRLGTRTKKYVEVVDGLKDGQRIVRAGQQKVFEGAKVIPVSSPDSVAAWSHDSTAAVGDTAR
jgi:membrane fusion protein (multidrug efflux system)